jgi:hypothetical protein
MKLGEAINKLIKDTKHSHASLAAELGKKSPSSISNAISRNNMNIDSLLEITDKLGYEIIIRPTRGEDKAERTVKVER